jgi:hypothetical protein
MIKYQPKQDRRSFAEKHAFAFFAIIALGAAIALNSFHNRTQLEDTVKNPNPEILKIVFAIHSNH